MKKLSLILTLALAISLCACGGNKDASKATETPKATEAPEATKEADTDENADADTDENNQEAGTEEETNTEGTGETASVDGEIMSQDQVGEISDVALTGNFVASSVIATDGTSMDYGEYLQAKGTSLEEVGYSIYQFSAEGQYACIIGEAVTSSGTYTFDGTNVVLTDQEGTETNLEYSADYNALAEQNPETGETMLFLPFNNAQ